MSEHYSPKPQQPSYQEAFDNALRRVRAVLNKQDTSPTTSKKPATAVCDKNPAP